MEDLLRQTLDNAPDAIVISDGDGTILFWNRGAELIFGHSSAEALGSSLDLIIPENLRARHWEGYRRVMASGETKYPTGLLTAPGICKDGTRISLEFSMILLRDRSGAMAGIASIMRDVTGRWQKERELKQKLAESLDRR